VVAANAARLLIEGDQLARESPERHVQLTDEFAGPPTAIRCGPARRGACSSPRRTIRRMIRRVDASGNCGAGQAPHPVIADDSDGVGPRALTGSSDTWAGKGRYGIRQPPGTPGPGVVVVGIPRQPRRWHARGS